MFGKESTSAYIYYIEKFLLNCIIIYKYKKYKPSTVDFYTKSDMETRKIQLSGGTTYTVSLPKSWARENGIESGSQVSLYPKGDGSILLEVTGNESKEKQVADLDVATTDTEALEEQLSALYMLGYDIVKLRDKTGHPPERQRAIELTIDTLSGFELIEATDTYIELTNLIEAEKVDIRKSTLRIRLVALSMHSDAINAITQDNDDLAQRVVSRDDEVDKLFSMVTRHFRRSLQDLREVKKLGVSRDLLFEYYYVCRQFERIADHSVKMARFVSETDTEIPSSLVDQFEQYGDTVYSILDKASDVILTGGDIQMAQKALVECDRLLADVDPVNRDLYNSGDPQAAYITGLLLDSIRRNASYGANIATIGIQQALRQNQSITSD